MRMLVIGTLYEPDLGPSAPLFTMLCKELVKLGNEVTVITAVPHYPTGQVSREFRGKLLWRSLESDVNIVRVALPSVRREKLIQRFFQYLCFQIGTCLAGLNMKYDVVLAANPFLTVWLPFVFLGTLRHKPIIYSVNDVYPDVGIALGVFKSKPVIALVSALEGYCLRHSSVVQIISDSFKAGLRRLGAPDEKMVLVRNWVDTDLIRPKPRMNEFAREYHLEEKFVVLYAGNMGMSQGLETMLAVAQQMLCFEKLRFVFVGDGISRERLVAEAKERHLANVQFIPFQPRECLPDVLATANVSLVILRKGIGMDSLPSKILSILASARPVLLSVDERSESWKLIDDAKAGLCVTPENPSDLAAAIYKLMVNKDLCETYGKNGRLWVEKYHSPTVAAEQFHQLLSKALLQTKQ